MLAIAYTELCELVLCLPLLQNKVCLVHLFPPSRLFHRITLLDFPALFKTLQFSIYTAQSDVNDNDNDYGREEDERNGLPGRAWRRDWRSVTSAPSFAFEDSRIQAQAQVWPAHLPSPPHSRISTASTPQICSQIYISNPYQLCSIYLLLSTTPLPLSTIIKNNLSRICIV